MSVVTMWNEIYVMLTSSVVFLVCGKLHSLQKRIQTNFSEVFDNVCKKNQNRTDKDGADSYKGHILRLIFLYAKTSSQIFEIIRKCTHTEDL